MVLFPVTILLIKASPLFITYLILPQSACAVNIGVHETQDVAGAKPCSPRLTENELAMSPVQCLGKSTVE